jgi:hypothetical protein
MSVGFDFTATKVMTGFAGEYSPEQMVTAFVLGAVSGGVSGGAGRLVGSLLARTALPTVVRIGSSFGVDVAVNTAMDVGLFGADPFYAVPMNILGSSLGLVGRHSFVTGTKIPTESGLRNIEDLKPGDSVWSRDPVSGIEGLKKVAEIFQSTASEVVRIKYRLSSPDETVVLVRMKEPSIPLTMREEAVGANEPRLVHEFVGTPEHPVYSASQERWVQMRELQVGEELWLFKGMVGCVVDVSIESTPDGKPLNTYNLEVEDWHTYYVSPDGPTTDTPAVWVHNAISPKRLPRVAAQINKAPIIGSEQHARESLRILKSVRRQSEKLVWKAYDREFRSSMRKLGYSDEVRRNVRLAVLRVLEGQQGAAGTYFHNLVFHYVEILQKRGHLTNVGMEGSIFTGRTTTTGMLHRRKPDFYIHGSLPEPAARSQSLHARGRPFVVPDLKASGHISPEQSRDIRQIKGREVMELYYRIW